MTGKNPSTALARYYRNRAIEIDIECSARSSNKEKYEMGRQREDIEK
jgi:hypothetical protein